MSGDLHREAIQQRGPELAAAARGMFAGDSAGEVLEAICKAAACAGVRCCAWITLSPDGTPKPEYVAYEGRREGDELARIAGCRAVVRAFEEHRVVIGATDDYPSRLAEHALRNCGVRAVMAVPVPVGNDSQTILAFASARADAFVESRRPFFELLCAVFASARSATGQRVADTPEVLYGKLVEELSLLAVGLHEDGQIAFMTERWWELTGLSTENYVGSSWSSFFEDLGAKVDARGIIRQATHLSGPLTIHTQVNLPKCGSSVLRWSVSRAGAISDGRAIVVAVAQDVTRETKLERSIERSARLRSIGQTVGGVVHELRNPLTGVKLSAEMLDDEVTSDRGRRLLQRLASAAERAEQTIDNVLRFVRGDEGPRMPVCINDLVTQSLQLVRHQISADGIGLSVDLAEDVPPLQANSCELQQVLINLLLNAQHAVAQGGGGQVWLSTRATGSGVRIEVADDGPGIDEEILAEVFEPLVTTKQEYGGTGLGLHICRRIVQAHGGRICARNRAEGGARFVIELPVSRGDGS